MKRRELIGRLALVMVALCVGLVRLGTPAQAQGSDALVRVIHASPDAPAVDIWVDGAVTFKGMKFDTATDLTPLAAGNHEFAIVPKGLELDAAVLTTSVELEAGKAYEVAAVGLLADLDVAVWELDLAPVTADAFRIRVVNVAADGTTIDVADGEGTELANGLGFGDASDPVDHAGGVVGLALVNADSGDTARTINGIPLRAGKVFDLYVVGQAADNTLNFLVLSADPATAVGGAVPTGGDANVSAIANTGVGISARTAGVAYWLLALIAASVAAVGIAIRPRTGASGSFGSR